MPRANAVLSIVGTIAPRIQAEAILPKNLGEIAPTLGEDIEIAGMGIALQTLLNRQSQALHAAAHVRVPSADPAPDAPRDHRRLRTSGPAPTPKHQHSRQR